MPKPATTLRSRSLGALLLSYAYRAALECTRPQPKRVRRPAKVRQLPLLEGMR